MRTSKFTDEELEMCEAMGMKPSDIAKKYGATPSAVAQRQRKRNKKASPVEPKQKPMSAAKAGKKPVKPKAQEVLPAYEVPAPPPGTELLRYKNISARDRLLRNGKPVTVKSIGPAAMTINDRFGYKAEVTRQYLENNPGKFTRDENRTGGGIEVKKIISGNPIGTMEKEKSVEELFKPEPTTAEPTDLKTKFEKVAEKLKEETSAEKLIEAIPTSESPAKDLAGRKPATINQDFEDAVRQMEEKHETKKKSAIPPMAPVHIDLEMDDSADPVELPAKSDPEDYTDPEWFDRPIPRKGTVERVIWDKAYKEICEIQTLRSTIRTALDRGDRLPASEVDRYNKYVSKYGEEAGA